MTESIVLKTIELRKKHKLKTPDAIIASTAIIYNLTLISNDTDFLNIKGLTVLELGKL